MEISQRFLSEYYEHPPILIYRRGKKDHQYIIKDGYISYIITIVPEIKCQCCNYGTICYHILYVLIEIYRLTDLNILYFHKTYQKFIDLHQKQNDVNINKTLMDYITTDVLDHNCGVCLCKIKIRDDLFECRECRKYAHSKCINKWFQKSKSCIYCKATVS